MKTQLCLIQILICLSLSAQNIITTIATIAGADSMQSPGALTAGFTYVVDTNDCSGSTYIFVDQSSGNITSWLWDFGDGDTSSIQNPVHDFNSLLHSPPYLVKLIVTDNSAAQDSFSVSIFPSVNWTFGVMAINISHPTCNGQCNGAATALVTGTSFPQELYRYVWSNGETTRIATSLCAGTISVTVYDIPGCSGNGAITSFTIVAPSLTASFTFTNSGSTFNFQNTSTSNFPSNAWNYAWNFGDGSISAQQNPSHTFSSNGNYNVCLVISDTSGCSDSTCTIISVSSTQNLVWPGDANSDGIANVWDVLAIGIGYNNSGPARPNATTNWIGQPCLDWVDTFTSGVNYKHADCNGEGLIDFNDIAAISLNYGLTHAKNSSEQRAINPDLFLVFPQDTFQTGDTVSGEIHLGSQAAPVNNVYGIAFSLTYNQNIIDSNGISVDFVNSWFTPQTNRIGLAKNLYSAAKTDVGLSRTNHSNASGSGVIANVSFVIQDNIDGKDYFVLPLELQFEDVLAIDMDEAAVNVTANGDTLYVEGETVGINQIHQNYNVNIFPNPAADEINVVADFKILECCILDIAGRKLSKEIPSLGGMESLSLTIDVSALETGSYFIQLKTADHYSICRKLMINRH